MFFSVLREKSRQIILLKKKKKKEYFIWILLEHCRQYLLSFFILIVLWGVGGFMKIRLFFMSTEMEI